MFLLYACGLDRNEMRNGSMKNCQAWKYYEILKRTRANAFAPSSIQRRAIILRLMFWMHTHKQPIGFSHYPTSVSLLKLERKKNESKIVLLVFFSILFSCHCGRGWDTWMKWKTKNHHNVWCSIFRFMVGKSHKHLIFIHSFLFKNLFAFV